MKRIFTIGLAVALGVSAYAQGLKILCPGSDINDSMMNQLYGEAISADGKYVCGAVSFGDGIFVADAFTGEVKFVYPDTNDNGCELRGVSNDGLCIGYAINGITYSFDTAEVTRLETPKGSRGTIGEGVTNDGSLFVGSILEGGTVAAYLKNGGEWTKLPLPAEEDILRVFPKVPETSAAKRVSGDGKVILGYLGEFGVPCVWTLNDNGEYVADLFPVRFLKLSADDINNDERPLSGISAQFLSLSNNGRYAAMVGSVSRNGNDYENVAVVYDIQEKTLKVYSEIQEVDDANSGLYPSAISDDGTFIGTVGQMVFGSYGSFIMKPGETQAEMFMNVFPEFNERYGLSDILGFNVPTGISADSRYILCYTFYADDYNDVNSPAYIETYIIDRGEDVGVDQMASANCNSQAIYSIDGRSLRELTKGINIIRNADGSVTKILKK